MSSRYSELFGFSSYSQRAVAGRSTIANRVESARALRGALRARGGRGAGSPGGWSRLQSTSPYDTHADVESGSSSTLGAGGGTESSNSGLNRGSPSSHNSGSQTIAAARLDPPTITTRSVSKDTEALSAMSHRHSNSSLKPRPGPGHSQGFSISGNQPVC